MSRTFVVGDVHGMFAKLLDLMKKIKPEADDRIIFIGDLIDRGPNSDRVVNFVRTHGYECVRGNHEQMAIDAQHSRLWYDTWMFNGGQKTLTAYASKEKELQSDIEWMKTLPFYVLVDDTWLLSHAGVPQGYTVDAAVKPEADGYIPLLWHRGELENSGHIQIVGHTPILNPILREREIYIDTGAFTSRPLTAVELTRREIIQSR